MPGIGHGSDGAQVSHVTTTPPIRRAGDGPQVASARGVAAVTWLFIGHDGLAIRMSPERLAHVLEHPEMAPLAGAIAHTLARPERVIQSRSDPHARLYYRYHRGTLVGDKYACVVVKVGLDDAFVVTAYLTDQIKRGIRLWPPST